jgi:predicted heme/steroid binding protein
MAPRGNAIDIAGKSPLPVSKTEHTWQEVARHNTAESAWVIVRGKVYDITNFLSKHPGGREMLLLSAGRDCTDLFQCYHAFTDKPEKVLEKYEIGVAVGPPEFVPFAPDTTGFWNTLRGRVADHFKRTRQNPKSAVGGALRMLPVIALLVYCWLVMNRQLLPDVSMVMRAIAAVIFGVCQVRTLRFYEYCNFICSPPPPAN